MRIPRFGKMTTTYYMVFVMVTAAIVGYSFSEFNPWVYLFATSVWALFCIFYIDSWFFPVKRREYQWKSYNSILVAFDSAPIYMFWEKDRNIVILEPRIDKTKNFIRIHESHLNGSDRIIDGIESTNVNLLAGKFTARKINEGFLVEWNSMDSWKVSGEK